jgi:hypothetical protein
VFWVGNGADNDTITLIIAQAAGSWSITGAIIRPKKG